MAKKFFLLRNAFLLLNLIAIKSVKAELIKFHTNFNTSFSFSVKPHTLYIPQGRFFVGAKQPIPNNDFAVAAAIRNESLFTALTPEKVTLNNVPDQANPLNGAGIKFLVMIGRQPLVVQKSQPASIYMIDDFINRHAIEVFSANNIADANGKTTSKILALTSSAPNSITLPAQVFEERMAFAAVANRQGQFDGDGSGIAVILLEVLSEKVKNQEKNLEQNREKNSEESTEDNSEENSQDAQTEVTKSSFKFDIINAQNGKKSENKAAPLGKDSDVIKIENPVTSIGNKVALHFDPNLRRDDKHPGLLYIALDVQSGSNSQDGARAVVLAQLRGPLSNDSESITGLKFSEIAPDSVFLTDDKIVGTRGANKKVSINKIKTMFTTTHLHYLIVVGGNGDTDTKRKVFSLPLVNDPTSEHNGKLAKADSIPVNVFAANPPHTFLTRAYLDPAIKSNDLFNQNSVQARVGANGILPGDINDIQVVNDTVFVSTTDFSNEQQPGIFFSQALFDQFGRISGWTNWQRASAGGFRVSGFALDPLLNYFWYIPQNNDLTTENVFRTSWDATDTPLVKIAAREFDQSLGGVKGLFSFPFYTNGLSQNLKNRISFLILTGVNKIALIQTGNDPLGFFGPSIIEVENKNFISTDGSLRGFNDSAQQIYISGGVLSEIFNINSADIICNKTPGTTSYGWLAIGGSNGLAILTKPDGSGWDATSGLGTNFSGLTGDMEFRKIGSYCNIRKIISSHNRLFVLTSQKLDVIEIDKSAIENNNFKIRNLAKALDQDFKNTLSFSDMIVSPPQILLATSSGLFKSTNLNSSIISSEELINWQKINLPESVGPLANNFSEPASCGLRGEPPVTRLFSISKTGFETDTSNDGNIFALNASVGLELAQIYRLTLKKNTVSLFPDYFIGLQSNGMVAGKNSYFVNLLQYRNYAVTDGAIIGVSQSAFSNDVPKFILLPTRLKSGQKFAASQDSIKVNLNISNAHTIGQAIRDASSGNWIIPGDFGLRINQ